MAASFQGSTISHNVGVLRCLVNQELNRGETSNANELLFGYSNRMMVESSVFSFLDSYLHFFFVAESN